MSTDFPEFNKTALRIRTLTATLRRMHNTERPPSSPSEVSSFLRHMATLLTCGSDTDPPTKQVVAVTGGIEETGVKTLVVVQNESPGPEAFSLQGHDIAKSDEPFDEIISGPSSVPLEKHISDLLGLLPRCKLYSRLTSDTRRWSIRVHEALEAWVPDEGDSSLKTLWVKKPRWAGHFYDHSTEVIEKRSTDKGEEWQFSQATAAIWAQALAGLLASLERKIKQYRGSCDTDKKHTSWLSTNQPKPDFETTLRSINDVTYSLYTFVYRNSKILKMLLAQKSLQKVFRTQRKRVRVNSARDGSSWASDVTAERDDEEPELAHEMRETEGDCVYRYLQLIVAWHAAIESLLQPRYRNVLSNISVGMVEVAGSEPELMQADEFVAEYYARRSFLVFNATKVEVREVLEPAIPKKFSGTIHAEATLMGLLTYFSRQGDASYYAGDILNINILKESIEPALVKPAIGVGKKCCWCCYRLATLLPQHYGDENPISLPGTHGILYGWCPPRVGVEVEVLKRLESKLWVKLDRAIHLRLLRREAAHSRQSSGIF
ncbi:unnamed protein product [Cyclocybe aegerita]|uniref:Uncharacterized protein n=1 Tax=Cyclocybe aegerita TaxID=1973307 RepID=A0A8S0W4X5_CYCAE|nr:unnamed protein product [Cyclocybe aegerita]